MKYFRLGRKLKFLGIVTSHGIKTKFFSLKGVFAKNEREIGLRRKIFLSVASIKRKLLNTSHTKERNVHTNSELQLSTRIVKKSM